jgi:hypothetical protein
VVLFIDMAHVRKFEELAAQADDIQAEADALNDEATELGPEDARAEPMREKARQLAMLANRTETKARQAVRNVPVVALWKTTFASGKIRGALLFAFLKTSIANPLYRIFLPAVCYRGA